jgi:hypothetical protein
VATHNAEHTAGTADRDPRSEAGEQDPATNDDELPRTNEEAEDRLTDLTAEYENGEIPLAEYEQQVKPIKMQQERMRGLLQANPKSPEVAAYFELG